MDHTGTPQVGQISPLARASHESRIHILSEISWDTYNKSMQVHTGVDNGKIGSVSRRNLDKKVIPAVLHSNASMANSSRTPNVNAVLGLSAVAG
jgi:hypothetical protein